MEMAVASLCFRDRNTDEIMETIEYGSEIGFRLLEIAGPLTWDAGSIQWMDRIKFQNALEKAEMTLTGSFFPPIPTSSVEKAIEWVPYITMVADFVAEMGGSFLASSGGPRRPRGGIEIMAQALDRILNYIEQKNYDLRVCFESLDPQAALCGSASGKQICMPEDYERLFEEVPSDRVGVNLDIGHVYAACVDVVDFIRRFSDKIVNVHIKDIHGMESVAIGKGDIDLPSVIRALKEIGYDGPVALELELSDPENAYEHVKTSYNAMKKLIR
jgi:sugar phosphate isomerase/epimerase